MKTYDLLIDDDGTIHPRADWRITIYEYEDTDQYATVNCDDCEIAGSHIEFHEEAVRFNSSPTNLLANQIRTRAAKS